MTDTIPTITIFAQADDDGQSSDGDGQSSDGDGQSSDGDGQSSDGDGQSSDGDGGVVCGNGDSENADKATTIQQAFIEEITRASDTGEGTKVSFAKDVMGASFSGHFALLTPTQQAIATSVFGTSLSLGGVYLSDFQGVENRAFTLAFVAPAAISMALGLSSIYVINCGSFNPATSTLIHELTHVWQSQHHRDPIQYIQNSVDSQELAVSLNVTVGSSKPRDPYSPYAYIPGKAFNEYAAEQIAKQVEKGVASIVGHVSNIPLNARDPDNEIGLATARCENKKQLGVKW